MLFTGTYQRILRKNHVTGITYFTVVPNEETINRNRYGNVTCVGVVPPLLQGIPVQITGSFDSENQFMNEAVFRVDSMKECYDDTISMVAYLSSRHFPGIGSVTAENICQALGKDIEKIMLREDAEEYITSKKIPRLSRRQIRLMVQIFRQTADIRQLYTSLESMGIQDYTYVDRLLSLYGIEAKDEFFAHPYKVGFAIDIPFRVSDYIFYKQGHIPFCEERLRYLVLYVLKQVEHSGDTCTDISYVIKRANAISAASIYQTGVTEFMIRKVIKKSTGLIYYDEASGEIALRETHRYEEMIIHHLTRLTNSKRKLFSSLPKVREDYIPAAEQKESYNMVLHSGVKILIGGPGTGKSTTIDTIIRMYQTGGYSVKLCAPTGRAAQRITEITGSHASTVHKLLDCKKINKELVYRSETDPINADVIIVDESGMLDTELLYRLLAATPSGATIILVGDENQLPSVGAGNILHDLTHSRLFELYRLSHVYRQKDESLILQNIRRIEQGEATLLHGSGCKILRADQPEVFEKYIQNIIEHYHEDMQILSMTRVGDMGTSIINLKFQEKMQYQDVDNILEHGKNRFHVGDKVIMTKNNYDVPYWNGDIGRITSIQEDRATIRLDAKDSEITITSENLQDVELAYAISIHKSQGSQYPVGVVILSNDYPMLFNRNLLFTAVSRFQEEVVVISKGNALENALKNINAKKRKTGLSKLLEIKM